MGCIFCKIIKSREQEFKVWEDKDFFLKLDINPINPGHLLLIPKKHILDVFNMPDSLYIKLFALIKKVVPILKTLSKAKRIGLAIEGFGVNHAHVHLVPVNKGNELNPLKAKKANPKELKKSQLIYAKKFIKL